ncbi:hypothetical protein PHYSODRAFT_333535 [Phytophthora sojae]|uniref:Uncharacterized protein n=1 Tax=Phytophthora sojae (strain P6497) TaxID=1094619 RepID=G4ZL44_PHYSP|nr:hypothetical protein PHYSODRAFT_333535 [Phytophthora sojae]EGZ15266.1 hypothetical protein PHYSODRAFT_333535 [Phytophthora sojae]|eukprot:XP_009529015.1 hypothetical protein PHYSODRAFT_333535 [Phytophthora sojae]
MAKAKLRGRLLRMHYFASSSSSSSNSSSCGDAWEAPTEFQSRNVSWWKAVEVVLAPHTAEAQIRLSLSGLNVVVELVDNK